jgi:hypothetical protein
MRVKKPWENAGRYLDLSREVAAVRQNGGGGRHGEEEENVGELCHGCDSDQGLGRLMSCGEWGVGGDHIGQMGLWFPRVTVARAGLI